MFQGFYHRLYMALIDLPIWHKKRYGFQLIPITCSTIGSNEVTFECDYDLSKISRIELTKFATKLRKGKKPALVIFASCYSFESTIKDLLFSNGAMASLSITQDKGIVTGGKSFTLDEDQQSVIKEFAKVKFNSKSIISPPN